MEKGQVFKALVDGNLDELEDALQAGVDVNMLADFEASCVSHSKIGVGDTLCHVASATGDSDALDLLLRFGANINISSGDGSTPLLIATVQGHDCLAMRLLENGANFAAQDRYGSTILHWTDNLDIIQFAVDKGLPVDIKQRHYGRTPLHFAAYHGQTSKARLLLARGADVGVRGNAGETPLHVLMATRWIDVDECATVLLGAGAGIDDRDSQENTPLHWAVGANSSDDWLDRGNPRAVEFLLDHGANARARNRSGLTPMAIALRTGNADCRRPFRNRRIWPTPWDLLRMLF